MKWIWNNRIKIFIFFVIASFVVLSFRICMGHYVRMQLVNQDSAVSHECSIVRVYLMGYYSDYGHYPEKLNDTIDYKGEDYHLRYKNVIYYTPDSNRISCELSWIMASENGVVIYEKLENGAVTSKGMRKLGLKGQAL